MKKEKFTFRASSDEHNITAYIYSPQEVAIRGVIQIAHGMSEYAGRYEDFITFLVKNNFAVSINDHAGHGESIVDPTLYGYIADTNGYEHMVSDMYQLTTITKEKFKNIPYILIGHSMGSFLARYYCSKHGNELAKIIYIGTSGGSPLLNIGLLLSNIGILLKGKKASGTLIDKIAFGASNQKIKNPKTKFDWLSRDENVVLAFEADKKCGFVFTNSAFKDLFLLLKKISHRDWAFGTPKNVPTLLLAGTCDPVGDYGKGVRKVYDSLRTAGSDCVFLKLYADCRHELLNELNKQEVYADILNWIL